jgi:glutamate-1-semialdehyde 2,1-aminomutase
MLKAGVYMAPSQYEAGFTSTVHSAQVIDATIAASESAFKRI